MTDSFWNVTEPPCFPDVRAWCAKEVETACTDLMSQMGVWGQLDDDVGFGAYPFSHDGNWDLESTLPNAPLAELILDAAKGQTRYMPDDPRHGIHLDEIPKVEAGLLALEEAIANVRALYKRT